MMKIMISSFFTFLLIHIVAKDLSNAKVFMLKY